MTIILKTTFGVRIYATISMSHYFYVMPMPISLFFLFLIRANAYFDEIRCRKPHAELSQKPYANTVNYIYIYIYISLILYNIIYIYIYIYIFINFGLQNLKDEHIPHRPITHLFTWPVIGVERVILSNVLFFKQ